MREGTKGQVSEAAGRANGVWPCEWLAYLYTHVCTEMLVVGAQARGHMQLGGGNRK